MDNPLANLSKNQKIAVAVGAVGIGGYIVYSHHKSSGSWNPFSTASTTATTATSTGTTNDPITGLPYSDDYATDPVTGDTYLQEATQYGSVAAAEATVTAYGQSTATGSGIPVNPASPAPTGSLNTPVGSSVYTSNAAWSQAATAGLVSVGYDGTTVANALGAYLTQTPETPDQVAITNTAIAEYGPAPVGSLQVIRAPASGPGAGIPVTPPTVTQGHQTSVTQTSANLSWTGNNAVKYVTTLTGPGPHNGQVQTVTNPQVSYTGLDGLHNYSIQILPYSADGTRGEPYTLDFQTLGPQTNTK